MSQDSSKKQPTHKERKPPAKYYDNSKLTEAQKKMVQDYELSEIEFARYQNLPPYKKAEIISLLTERKRLNLYVLNHLQEEINKQFGPLMQFFLPSENDLKYALQKVDEIETAINETVGEELPLFDREVTKRNRLETLLITAHAYKDLLNKELHASHKPKQLGGLQKKRDAIGLIIEELHTQLDKSEYFVHNKDILKIRDSEIGAFISKLKTIGIDGFAPKVNKFQPTFFNISILTTIYERLQPKSDNEIDSNPQSKRNGK